MKTTGQTPSAESTKSSGTGGTPLTEEKFQYYFENIKELIGMEHLGLPDRATGRNFWGNYNTRPSM